MNSSGAAGPRSNAAAASPGPSAPRGQDDAATRAGAEQAAHGYRDLLPKFMMCARPTPVKSVVNFGTSLPSSHAKALSH